VSVLHVGCSASEEYTPHSAAMLHSVLARRGALDVHAHYLVAPDYAGDAREKLAAMFAAHGATITFTEVPDELVTGLSTAHRFPKNAWYRLYLPDLLADVDRVLYLDVDTIAVDRLDGLWATDLRGNLAAAVTNVFEPWSIGRPAELGLAGPEGYFNSGVMLMDLAGMRRAGLTAAMVDLARAYGDRLLWADQDALNLVLRDGWLRLPPRWNCMNAVLVFDQAVGVFGAEAIEEARRDPGIRHFEGPSFTKPWNYMCDLPMRELYTEHRRQTPWADFVPEARTRANRVRRTWRRFRPLWR
jgi:lipopolysaccharide biosynthesis glycosyltransferase